MKLQYKLTGPGWAEATVEVDGQVIRLIASYLSDALGDMTAAAIAVLKGQLEVRFSFDDEPCEYRWITVGDKTEAIRLTILEFPELWSNAPDDRGNVLLDIRTTRREFSVQVLSVLDQIKDNLGEVEYKARQVQSDFPSEKYEVLKGLLASK